MRKRADELAEPVEFNFMTELRKAVKAKETKDNDEHPDNDNEEN